MTTEEENKKWTHNYKLLLLNARLEMEKEFREKKKKRMVLWNRVLENIKTIDESFPFSRDDIYRKFLNFMVTYKRIKKRSTTPGEAVTTWEFFDSLDEVYGCQTDIFAPECNLEPSFEILYADLTGDTNDMSYAAPTQHESSPPASKRKRVDIAELLIKESQADRKLLEGLLNCEKEKIRIEKEKIKEIRKLREAILATRK